VTYITSLSVVIPGRNRPHALHRLLDSVHAALQGVKISAEVIVVDDHSHPEIDLDDPGFGDSIKILRNHFNAGPSYSRNLGAKAARAESIWILFLDDDLILDGDYFKNLGELKLDEDIVGIEGTTIVNSVQGPLERHPARKNFSKGFGSGNVLYRKEVFLRLGGFDEKYFHPSGIHFREDTDLGLRMLSTGVILFSQNLIATHPGDGADPWFLIKDARKYYFEAYFLVKNPEGRRWIGSALKKGKLGTFQLRGALSDLLVLGVLVGVVTLIPGLSFFLGIMYGVLGALLLRGFRLKPAEIPMLLVVVLVYPWVHSFYYWKGALLLAVPYLIAKSSLRWKDWISVFSGGASKSSLLPLPKRKSGMRVLQVVRQFYPCVGGMEEFVMHLSAHLLRLGHHVEVLTLDHSLSTSDLFSPVEEIETRWGKCVVRRVGARHLGPWFIPELQVSLIENYDLIHIHGTDGFLEEIVSLREKKYPATGSCPLVLSTHGGFFHSKNWNWVKNLWFRTRTRAFLRKVDLVMACSHEDARIFETVCERLVVLENGAHLEDLRILEPKCPDPDRLLFVGGLYSHKRIEILLKLIQALRVENPGIHLEIVGDGPMKEGLLKQVSARKLEKSVSFLGQISREDLVSAYQRAGIFVSASQFEGFGISVVEAMSAGCLLLLNQIPSFQSFVTQHTTGLEVPFDDMSRVLEGYRALAGLSETQRSTMSQECRSRSERYSWDKVSEEFERQYLSLLEEVTFPSSNGSL